jgi:hypothetical protein
MLGCCEHANDSSGSIKRGTFFDWFLFKEDSVSWSRI